MEFRGANAFLSTLYNCKQGVTIKIGKKEFKFKNSEAAFQAQKVKNYTLIELFTKLDGKTAKAVGKVIEAREDWEDIKEKAMYKANKAKFEQDEKLYEKLAQVDENPIIHDNYWNDTEWGVVNGVGLNKLGNILTKIKHELAGEDE